ncbi:hypothetical protein PCS_03322 [Desulfocurvibacter africanus PCS]|uniref:Uncharacterized protein n=1 Tax=Desulfocurvibacter africanus PCS TaxID=1262666 RepID=M5PPD4_DESAF|nr:hypothetical protein PCS_03322 [Desulfocurvibacter africanus PCS]
MRPLKSNSHLQRVQHLYAADLLGSPFAEGLTSFDHLQVLIKESFFACSGQAFQGKLHFRGSQSGPIVEYNARFEIKGIFPASWIDLPSFGYTRGNTEALIESNEGVKDLNDNSRFRNIGRYNGIK